MNNDTLIDQARDLYATLNVAQTRSIENKPRFERLERTAVHAYYRYLRRLNRCVLCYQYRLHDCIRELFGKNRKSCPGRPAHSTSK